MLKQATADGLVRAVSLRLPTLYGLAPRPGGERGVVAAMTRRALAGQPLTLWNDGTVRRDLLHVRDAAAAFAAALDHADALAGRHWPVGTGEGVALAELFTLIAWTVAEHTGEPSVPVRTEPPPDGAVGADQESVRVDPSAFHGRTGWRHAIRPRPGVRRTVAALVTREEHTSSLP
ncbi:putative UDP-glucose 4-epimerase [Streptomyces aurantiacus JA 4570]|uniref:Putative UDP-glucose 4-epimerase n=1 Tax=Streptomyces aurantiacus JA 4570 TaxID=1286094 RepID=S3ZJX4_9ACTN|nr:putative UDP-glucose 4-epimerase [Streptomyces aurantiacus JA 4570]